VGDIFSWMADFIKENPGEGTACTELVEVPGYNSERKL